MKLATRALAALLAGAPTVLAAQVPPPAVEAEPAAVCGGTADAAPDHFALRAARRAEALGLLDDPLPLRTRLSVRVVAEALRQAAANAAVREPARAATIEGLRGELLADFPGLRADAGCAGAPGLLGARAAAGFERWTGRVAPGRNQFPPDRTGALPLDDRVGPVATGWVQLEALRGVGVALGGGVGDGGARLERASVAVRAGGVTLSAGREPVGYEVGVGGSVILSAAVALDRVEVKRDEPLRLPGFLRVVGPVSYEALVGRLRAPAGLRRPYLIGVNATASPSDRLSLSVSRAIVLAGDEARYPTRLGSLLRALGGGIGGLGYENQILAAAARLRLPTEPLLPLTAYLEWGFEDAAGSWRDSPGRVVGLSAPSLPVYPPLELGVEYAGFVHSCCGNPPWYRHVAFPANWTSAERPLGHPLGGNGREWRGYARLDAPDRLHLSGDVYLRRRGDENLYVPGRERSAGVTASAAWRVTRALEVQGSLARESGDGWAENHLYAGLAVRY